MNKSLKKIIAKMKSDANTGSQNTRSYLNMKINCTPILFKHNNSNTIYFFLKVIVSVKKITV